jgi:hypothetical protein
MANSPSKYLLFAGVGVAIIALTIVNQVNMQLDPKRQEQLAREREEQAQKEAAAKATPSAEVSASPSPGGLDLATLGDDAIIGPETGTPKVTVGFRWTPQVQSNPELVLAAVRKIQQYSSDAKIRIVNIEVHPEVQEGIFIEQSRVGSANKEGALSLSGAIPANKSQQQAQKAAQATAPSDATGSPPPTHTTAPSPSPSVQTP